MLYALILGIIGAPLLSWAFTLDYAKAAFEKRRQKFLESGKGKDPMTEPYGPHKSFRQNLPIGFILCFAIGFGPAIAIKMAG
jgi:hypothetical protein